MELREKHLIFSVNERLFIFVSYEKYQLKKRKSNTDYQKQISGGMGVGNRFFYIYTVVKQNIFIENSFTLFEWCKYIINSFLLLSIEILIVLCSLKTKKIHKC